LVEHGPVAEVFANPQHPYTRKLLDSRPVRDVADSPPAPGAQPLLQADKLRVSYPTPLPGIKGWFKSGRFVAVKGADFSLHKGRTLAVIGESGSGKSTLALASLGLQAFEGQLKVDGGSWQLKPAADRPLRKFVQVVFQDPFSSLSPRMTV